MANKTEETKAQNAITIFGKMPKTNGIMQLFPPYALRNDCKIGMWKRGEEDYKCKRLEMGILHAQSYYGKIGYTTGEWLQLWFVPVAGTTEVPENVLMVTYLKTKSMTACDTTIQDILTQMIDPGIKVLVSEFKKEHGEYGDYYSIKWEVRDRNGEKEQKQLEDIATFVASEPNFVDSEGTRMLVGYRRDIDGDLERAKEKYKIMLEDSQEQQKALAPAK